MANPFHAAQQWLARTADRVARSFGYVPACELEEAVRQLQHKLRDVQQGVEIRSYLQDEVTWLRGMHRSQATSNALDVQRACARLDNACDALNELVRRQWPSDEPPHEDTGEHRALNGMTDTARATPV